MITKSTGGSEIKNITRPEYGQLEKNVPIQVHMSYKGIALEKEITLVIEHRALSDLEKMTMLKDFRKRLEPLILGENQDLKHITKPLILMARDPKTGITVDWTSSNPEVVSDAGEVNLIRAAEIREVDLRADLALDNMELTGFYKLMFDPEASQEDYEESLALTLKDHLAGWTKDPYADRITLPGELGDGVKIRWFSGKEDKSTVLLPVFLFMILIVYFKRYDSIDRENREAEISVNRDLPEFINKLVLLLNAGLVFSSAYAKIMEDYESFYHNGKMQQNKQKFLYEEMLEIQKRVDQSNASLIRELKEFSQRCGVREMVRLTAVISDNWNKGSTLAEKLENESNLLWISRKKRAEEKGKLAETKLTFPLMILLLVLIMVTIAPAMLEM
jgi:hypothetical protein